MNGSRIVCVTCGKPIDRIAPPWCDDCGERYPDDGLKTRMYFAGRQERRHQSWQFFRLVCAALTRITRKSPVIVAKDTESAREALSHLHLHGIDLSTTAARRERI